MTRAPFRWFEAVPRLLHPDGLKQLIAMAKQADASLRRELIGMREIGAFT
jgi:hypothetical protein